MSKAKDLALVIEQRLAGIRTANGYLTDIGAKVFPGKLSLDPSMLPCVVLVEGDDDVLTQVNMQCRVVLRFIAEGHASCDPERPYDKIHDIIADLKKAIFGGDVTFGGLVKPSVNNTPGLRYTGSGKGEPPDGAVNVTGSIQFECEVVEDLKNP